MDWGQTLPLHSNRTKIPAEPEFGPRWIPPLTDGTTGAGPPGASFPRRGDRNDPASWGRRDMSPLCRLQTPGPALAVADAE